MENRIDLLNMKGGAARYVVLTCCVVLFIFLLISTVATNNRSSEKKIQLFQNPSGSLSLSNKNERNTSIPTNKSKVDTFSHLTPFFFEPIQLNNCDRELLLSVSGIGPSLADNILKTRLLIGNFQEMNDLLLVPGIGDVRMHKFAKLFSFKINSSVN